MKDIFVFDIKKEKTFFYDLGENNLTEIKKTDIINIIKKIENETLILYNNDYIIPNDINTESKYNTLPLSNLQISPSIIQKYLMSLEEKERHQILKQISNYELKFENLNLIPQNKIFDMRILDFSQKKIPKFFSPFDFFKNNKKIDYPCEDKKNLKIDKIIYPFRGKNFYVENFYKLRYFFSIFKHGDIYFRNFNSTNILFEDLEKIQLKEDNLPLWCFRLLIEYSFYEEDEDIEIIKNNYNFDLEDLKIEQTYSFVPFNNEDIERYKINHIFVQQLIFYFKLQDFSFHQQKGIYQYLSSIFFEKLLKKEISGYNIYNNFTE